MFRMVARDVARGDVGCVMCAPIDRLRGRPGLLAFLAAGTRGRRVELVQTGFKFFKLFKNAVAPTVVLHVGKRREIYPAGFRNLRKRKMPGAHAIPEPLKNVLCHGADDKYKKLDLSTRNPKTCTSGGLQLFVGYPK